MVRLLERARTFSPHGISGYSKATKLSAHTLCRTDSNSQSICHIVSSLKAIVYTSTIITSALVCKPIQTKRDLTIPEECIDTMALIVTTSVVSIVSDIIIFALSRRVI
jgi:hypothetical protein